jgi:Xaa-Pro aminopeptidase
MTTMRRGVLAWATYLMAMTGSAPTVAAQARVSRPFGSLREQADRQQRWLQQRMDSVLPTLMRKHGVQMWVIPMREYNEDPVFKALVSPTTFAARRRTIYVFFDRGPAGGVERIALGGTNQGGVYQALRSQVAVKGSGAGVGGASAELWGDQQWQVLKKVVEDRQPKNIALDISRTFAFADGLTAGELDGMTEALGADWARRFIHADGLAVDFIASRVADERVAFRQMADVNWGIIREMFSGAQITPGTTRPIDLMWFYRDRLTDLGLGTWFQPSVGIQRQGVRPDSLTEETPIEKGDVLWCDVGITIMGLNTDIQHDAYVLRDGETAAPAGLTEALHRSNRLQDIVMDEIRPGRTGNEILAAARARMTAAGLQGTVYSHPIGLNGHGSGPLIGLWDYQDGVEGRGDHTVIPNMWFSIELQVTSPVAEWKGQPVRFAQEEDMVIGDEGIPQWASRRQDALILVGRK